MASLDRDDDSLGDDDQANAEVSSNYSSVSEDSLPPIHAYGHTYYGDGRFFFPTDASEGRRMTLQHQLFKLTLDGQLFASKLPARALAAAADGDSPPFHVLEVGAGNGLWALDVGATYPQMDVLALDLTSALLPSDVPSNVTFEIADVAARPWPPRVYDFIHVRNLIGGGVRDFRALLAEAYAHLKPGGFLEFTDLRTRWFDVAPDQADLPAGETPEIGAACREYERLYIDMAAALGIDLDPLPKVPGWLAEIGAEAIRERCDWLPVKVWGNDPTSRKKGEILGEMIDNYLENWTLMLFGKSGWEEKDIRALLDKVRVEVQDPKLRSYASATFITARKPHDGDEDE